MRRTVGVLRDTGPEAADRRPVGDPAGITDLVEGFTSPAADATEVTVRLTWPAGRLEVTVTDDGHGGTQFPEAAHGGGFGIVGLTERVAALGGGLHAGPRAGGVPGRDVGAAPSGAALGTARLLVPGPPLAVQ